MNPMRRYPSVPALLLAACFAAACGNAELSSTPDAEELEQVESGLSVYSGTFSSTLSTWGVLSRNAQNEAKVVFTGSASRLLSDAFAFVPDDAFGAAEANERAYTVTLGYAHEVNSILSGLPLFVRLTTVNGTPNTFFLNVRAIPAPRYLTGSSLITVSGFAPVYAVDAQNPLRYRLHVNAPTVATQVVAVIGGSAQVSGTPAAGGGWSIDLTYAQLDAAFVGGLQVRAIAPSHTYQKSMAVQVKLSGLSITTGDPYEVWPSPVCTAQVQSCLAAHPTDLGTCGAYRQVQVCAAQNPCSVAPAPLSLLEIGDPSLEAARLAYNQQAIDNGAWASVSAVKGYALEGCGATLQTVVDLLAAEEQGAPDYTLGTPLATLPGPVPFFYSTYSAAGPALYNAANAFGGSTATGWFSSQPIPCHNCTQNQDRAVLFYPDTQHVVVVDGVHGWDS